MPFKRSTSRQTFFITLSNPDRGAILDREGIGTILNDDDPPILINVSDVTKSELAEIDGHRRCTDAMSLSTIPGWRGLSGRAAPGRECAA